MTEQERRALREVSVHLRAAKLIAEKLEQDCYCPRGATPPSIVTELLHMAALRLESVRRNNEATPRPLQE